MDDQRPPRRVYGSAGAVRIEGATHALVSGVFADVTMDGRIDVIARGYACLGTGRGVARLPQSVFFTSTDDSDNWFLSVAVFQRHATGEPSGQPSGFQRFIDNFRPSPPTAVCALPGASISLLVGMASAPFKTAVRIHTLSPVLGHGLSGPPVVNIGLGETRSYPA